MTATPTATLWQRGTTLLLVAASVCVGMVFPTQGGLNVTLGTHLGSQLLSGTINLVVASLAVALLRAAELLRQRRPLSAMFKYVVQSDDVGTTNEQSSATSTQLPPLHWSYFVVPGVIGAIGMCHRERDVAHVCAPGP